MQKYIRPKNTLVFSQLKNINACLIPENQISEEVREFLADIWGRIKDAANAFTKIFHRPAGTDTEEKEMSTIEMEAETELGVKVSAEASKKRKVSDDEDEDEGVKQPVYTFA